MLLTLPQLRKAFKVLDDRDASKKSVVLINVTTNVIAVMKTFEYKHAENQTLSSSNLPFFSGQRDWAAVKAATELLLQESEDYQEILHMQSIIDKIGALFNTSESDVTLEALQQQLVLLFSELKPFLAGCLLRQGANIKVIYMHGDNNSPHGKDRLTACNRIYTASNSLFTRIKLFMGIRQSTKQLTESQIDFMLDALNTEEYSYPAPSKERFNESKPQPEFVIPPIQKDCKEYYDTLGLDPQTPEADFEKELKRKYRKLALQFHPDKPTGDKEKFQKVQDAYEFLLNPENRKNRPVQNSTSSFGYNQ